MVLVLSQPRILLSMSCEITRTYKDQKACQLERYIETSAASPEDTALSISLSSEELLDENNHLVLLDGTGVVLVEGREDLIESLLGELISGSEVAEGVLDELLGLFLVEGTRFVDIISVPDLVNNTDRKSVV